MANNRGNSNISSKFRSFQNSMKQTMNDFTGMDKQRSFRSSTHSAMNVNASHSNKSPSGARQYQSGRRRSIDRTPTHKSHSSISSINGITAQSPSNKYQKRRKRSLLIGRESYNINPANSPSSDHTPSPSIHSSSPRAAANSNTPPALPPNFYPPESFVNLLYRITEMESGSNRNLSRFGLAILDIDNLRGHIQSPLQKKNPTKLNRTMQSPSSKNRNSKLVKPQKSPPTASPNRAPLRNTKKMQQTHTHNVTHKKHQSLPPRSIAHHVNDVNDVDDDEEDEEELADDSDEESMSASPLSTGVIEQIIDPQTREDDTEMKFIDDQDLITTKIQPKPPQIHEINEDYHNAPDIDHEDNSDADSSDDEYGIANIKPEPKSAAERTAAINNQRRKSSLLLRQQEIAMLQQYEANKNQSNNVDNNMLDEKERDHMNNGHGQSMQGKVGGDHMHNNKVEKRGNYLAVGATNMDPYLLFWNNSKKGESVVKVVQDIILMSISKEINATHFGFGEFAILANVSNEGELRRILKKILNKVSSNVSTEKLGPVTLSAGLAMYQKGSSSSQWVNQCRQACRLAKRNGRGRVANYITEEHRRKLAMELILEIKKPRVDFSGARVLELIRSGADLNFQFKYDTPLMVAIKKKNEIALRYIIQYDYNPNVQDKKGRTSLILALERETDALILDLLVSKRSLNPRTKDYGGNSALSIALKKGYRDIAKTLILLGSEPLLGEKTVLNQWFSAAKCGNIKTIEMMLTEMSFPIDMIDTDDMTALMYGASNGHSKLVNYLLSRGANINVQGHRGYTALMFAIENSKIMVFGQLIGRQDILIGLDGDDGTTILMCAAKGQMPEVIAVGLGDDTGVNINAVNFDGNTALMIACKYDSVSVATELLRNHCDLDIKNKLQQNALILSAKHGSSQIAAMLCTLGSNIDEQDKNGMTALMYAASAGYTGIVVNLIKYGADKDIQDNIGLTALEHANKNGKFEIVKMIKSGTLQDVTDILQQMEILKQKNKALSKNVKNLTEINNELSDRINATELAKNQMAKKLQDTMSKMTKQFTHRKISSPSNKESSPSSKQMNFPKMNVNLKEKMSGVSDRFNAMFTTSNISNNNNKQNVVRPPSKDMKL